MKELILLFAIVLWSAALILIPSRIAAASAAAGNDAWMGGGTTKGKPRIITVPEVEMAEPYSCLLFSST